MPKYKVNGRTFNIPDNEVDLFEADFPEAQLHYQTNDGRKFTIYANERKDFLSDFPDATELGWGETIKEQAKQADPFQPEDNNLAQPMFGSMSYQDNIGKPEDYQYYPSPLNEEGRAETQPLSPEERSKQEYEMLMGQLNEFNATHGNLMDTYEAYEKAARHQINEGGFAIDTFERRYLDENSNEYHQRKMEKDELNARIKSNSYFNQMRMAEADAANETVDAISNLMAQNEAENSELHKKMQAMNALSMNPRGSFSGFAKTKEMQEYMDERADLETAKRLYENTAQVYAAPINDGEDILKKFGQGFGQRVDDADFWTMGIIGIADDMNARAAFQKIQDKLGSVKELANLTDAEIDALLTPSEQLLISAVMDNNAAQYARMDNTSGAYQAGAGAADSLMFMAQFLLTGGIGEAATVGTAAHRRLVSWLGRKVGSMSNGLMKDVARGAVKLGVGTAESIGKALVMTPLMPHTYANIADKMMSFDDNGELMDTTDAIISGSIDALIETWSESTGDFVNKILGVPGNITKGVAKKVLKNVDFSDWGKAMNAPMMKILKKGGFNGFLGEMGEEFIGNATRSLVGTLAPGSGQDPEALKNFAQWEQLLITAGSFAPMTILGLGVSSAQYGWQKRQLNNAQKAFESMLREASYTEDQARFIVDELLGSTDANLTPEKLVANFSPLLKELAFNDRFANNRTQAMQSAVDFMLQIARYRTFDGVYHRQEEQQRNDMLAEIQEGTGREFWTTRLSENAGLDGTAYETDEVRAVEFNDGRVAYILGSDGTTNTVVYNDGQTGFLSEEQLNEGKTNGSIVSDATMGLNDYLTQQVARVRMTEEEQRMFDERNTNIGQVRAQFPIDATVELGTTEAPIQGVVRQQTPDGVIVESPAGISQLTWEELGHTMGIEVNPQTDAQMEEEAINNLEIADLQRRRAREQRRTQRNTAAEAALEEEQMLDEAENEGLEKPIPMKADGTVDQTAFWNESPARWAQWKTEQRQDGGAYASSYIQNAIGILEGQIAESEAAFLAESDFDAKDALEQTINQQRARLAELQDLSMQYMPSVISAETSVEATAEQTQPSEETSQPAAVMAERQKFELDAEYQRRLSLAKTLAEKEMILKEYFETISAGSMEAVVMNKQNYKQIMKDNGCDENAIERVTKSIKIAEEVGQAVSALHANDKIFVIADYNYTVEQGRVSYVHERQHNITKRNPELIQRVLSLGLSRETLQKIVRTLSGTTFYDNESDEVLADEILSSTMEIAYTFDDFSVTLSKLGLPIELINVLNEINDEQRNDFTLANARRNAIQYDNPQGNSGQNVRDQGEVSGGILGEEGDGSLGDSNRRTESGEPTTGGAETSEEGLQVPVAEVDEESEEVNPAFVEAISTDVDEAEYAQFLDDKAFADPQPVDGIQPDDVRFSIVLEDKMRGNTQAYFDKHYNGGTLGKKDQKLVPLNVTHFTQVLLDAANAQIEEMRKYMLPYLDMESKGKRFLPAEVYGKSTLFDNSSYGKTMENTLICTRTLAYIDFVEEVKKRIGRPLTATESFLASQMLYDIAVDPQCLYCYVSLDRKAYDEFLLRYIQQRDEVISKWNASDKSAEAKDALYKEFFAGRKPTSQMQARFESWLLLSEGDNAITSADLATKARRGDLKISEAPEAWEKARSKYQKLKGDKKLAYAASEEYQTALWNYLASPLGQVTDAEAYAQSASWAKKEEDYRSYTGELLKCTADALKGLMGHYGLRFYSFSEYSPAFILENMQMVRDAAARGLKGFAYTKEIDFIKIFAPTGMNINCSVYGRVDSEGNVVPDIKQGADWAQVQALREQYPNVGAVFVATNDEMVEWALNQPWIDVIIPFHIVRTGADIAKFYEWTNYSSMQADTAPSGKTTYIFPHEHHNDKTTFLKIAQERGLSPRFADVKLADGRSIVEHPNYMRLVNETRRSVDETPILTPTFNVDAAKESFDAFVAKGGYYSGYFYEDEAFEQGIETVVEDIKAGKTAKDVDYGRQDVPIDVAKIMAKRAEMERKHGKSGVIDLVEEARKADLRHRVAAEGTLVPGHKKGQPMLSDAEMMADVSFRITKNTKATIETWFNKAGVDPEMTEATINYLDFAFEDTTEQLCAAKWYLNGKISLPDEDEYKVRDAVKVAKQNKVDALSYASPMDILNTFGQPKSKVKPINPDTIKEFSNKKELAEGIVVYDVQDDFEGQAAVRKIIDTHWGEDANPWCLAARVNGDLDRAKEMWQYYSKYPKRIAFRNGKLLAFYASANDKTWWDRNDEPHTNIPYSVKSKEGEYEVSTNYELKEGNKKAKKVSVGKSDKKGRTAYFVGNRLESAGIQDGERNLFYSSFPAGATLSDSTYGVGRSIEIQYGPYKNVTQITFERRTKGEPTYYMRVGYGQNGVRAISFVEGARSWDIRYGINVDQIFVGRAQLLFNLDGELDSMYSGAYSMQKINDEYYEFFRGGKAVGVVKKYEKVTMKMLEEFGEDGAPVGALLDFINDMGWDRADYPYPNPMDADLLRRDDEVREQIRKVENEINEIAGGRYLSSVPAIRFRITPEMKEIKKQAEKDGTFMKAPNGADTNLTPEQWAMVRTKAFKAWFGDWINDPENASKVVDENGEPMVVYHGTQRSPHKYNSETGKFEKKTKKELKIVPFGIFEAHGEGMFFSEDKDLAKRYARGRKGSTYISYIYECFLNIRHPDYINADDSYKTLNPDGTGWIGADNVLYQRGLRNGGRANTRARAIQWGYDGFILGNHSWRDVLEDIRQYVAFFPSQIKSATENTGEFSNEDNDIRFRITPDQDKAYMDAVEAGDMETAQRMVIEAAKLAMPNTKVVDENGNPKVVYHGSTAMFTVFDKSRIGSATGTADGRGFYFTTDRDYALGYKTSDGQLFEVFLNIEKPLSYDKKTITKAQLRKILKEADRVEYEQEGEHYMLSNYANYNDVGIDAAVNEAANLEYDYADNDVELVGSLIGGSGSFDLIMDAVKKVTGKSGMIAPKDNGTIHYVVTDPAGIKSAEPVTYDNDGNVIPLSERFNPENEDIRFRVLDTTKAELKEKPIKLNGMYRFNLKNAFKGVKDNGGSYPYIKVQLEEVPEDFSGEKITYNGILEGFAVVRIPKGLITEGEKDNEFFIDPKAIEKELWDVLRATENYHEFKHGGAPYQRDWLNGEEIRFRMSNENQAIFVSNAAKAVEGIKQEKATPEQWLKMIEKNGGLKAGEDKWMGLSDWLKASDKKTLTKQEVLDFVNEHMIVIEEQHYSNEEMGKASVKILNEKYQGWEDAFSFEWDGYMEEPSADISDYEAAVELYNKHHDDKVALDEDGEFEDMDTYEKVRQFGVELSEIYHGSKSEVRPIDGTREQYTTQGLQHLHEIALTVPTIESWGLGGSNTVHFEDAGDGRAVAWIRFGDAMVYPSDIAQQIEAINEEIINYPGSVLDEEYKSIVARKTELRKQNKTNRVLVIDEIQSKRHQEGREKGYRVSDIEQWLSDNNVEVVESGEFYEFIKNGETDRRFSKGLMNYDIEKAKRLYVSGYNKSDIPDAPFDKNWHELAMKRMLRYAAENGYDVIAWTKGDQQAERYNIGGVISEIKATKYPRGYEVESYDKNGRLVLYDVYPDASAIADVYGKEVAQKIVESADAVKQGDKTTISGDNLRVGGEGMRGFYDKILPAFMNKYGKKWGVKVEDIDLPNLENGLTMHSIPVTEEMKASVMEGQVMFRMRGENESAKEFTDSIVKDFKDDYNAVAPIEIADLNTKEDVARFFNIPAEDITDDDIQFIKNDVEKKDIWAAYHPDLKKIVIFVRDSLTDSKKGELALIHENIHAINGKYPEFLALGEYLWNRVEEGTKEHKYKTAIQKFYPEHKWHDELSAYVVSEHMQNGTLDELRYILDLEHTNILNKILNTSGYGKERKSDRSGFFRNVLRKRSSGKVGRASEKKGGASELTAEERRIINEYFPGAFQESDEFIPVGTNRFGTVYELGVHSALEAAEFLLNAQEGYVKGVFSNKEFPSIDMAYGTEKGGLYHIYQKHIVEQNDFDSLEDMIATVEDVLENGTKINQGTNVSYDYEGYRASLAQSQEGVWLLTSFDTTRKKGDKKKESNTTIGDQSAANEMNGTLVSSDSFIDKDSKNLAKDNNGTYENIRYRVVSDQETLDRLNSEPTIKVYRAMQLIDGKLYPPMSAKVDGELRQPIELGQWEEAEERPDLVDEKGRFKLDKGNKSSLKARYNPYFHTSPTPLNDQFSSAQTRPELVTVEVEVPESELTSGYKAEKAKDSVGKMEWKAGVVQSKLSGTRTVILSRWDKPVRIVPDSEVADVIVDMFEGRDITMPSNVVTPSLRAELEKRGVPFVETDNQGNPVEEVSFRVTGTPTDEVVANGLQLTPAQTAEVAANIFAALPEESRKKITEGLNGNILGLKDAILQIPTSLATKEKWNDEDKQMADVVAEEMTKMTGEMTRPFSAEEGLWLLYNNLNKGTDLISQASRALVQRNLGFDSETLAKQEQAKEDVRFRTVGDASSNAEASLYNRGAANVWTRLKESYVDMMASVEELVKAIEKRTGKVAQGFENILLALNQQSSKGLAAMESYTQRFLNPMFDEIRRIMDETKMKYEDVVRYVILKHGLERNKKLAQRDARAHYQEIYDDIISKINSMDDRQKRTYLTNAQLKEADAKANLSTLQAVDTSLMTDEEKKGHKKQLAIARKAVAEAEEYLKRAEKIRSMSEQEAKEELDKIFEKIENGTDSVFKEMRENDYSGISSMFYDQLGVDRKNFSTEEQYQAALMEAKKDRYSSLKDIEAAAEAEVKSFEGKTDTKELWKRINAATKETLRQQYEANMISKDQYLNLRDMFEYYVPLRGFKDNTAEDMYTYYRKPNSTGYTKPILGAEGRKTEAESPFGWIAAMAGSAIASNVKNEAKLALYYFVSNRPENGIATISKTWFVDSGEVDERGKKIFKPAYPPFSEDLSSAEGKAQYEIWQANMKELQKKGQAYEAGQRLNLGNAVVNISDANKPEHIVNVKVGGKDYTIIINGNPRAAQAINGDLNIEGTAQDYSALFGPVLRWMSSVNTSYNPEFWITNMMRDMAFTMMAVNIKEDPAYRRKFSKNYRKAFKVVSLVAKNEKGTIGDSYLEQQYKDFVKYGGVTGYTQIKDSETWEHEIENYLSSSDPESLKSGKVMRGMMSAFHAAHRFGESLEQVSRFAAFLTARETGKSINEAINDAKEITVNFNRKGSGKMITLEEAKYLTGKNGQPLTKPQQWMVVGLSSIAPLGRRFIMFFNAAIQGLNATYKLMKKNPKRFTGWALGYAAVGMMNAVLHAMMDDDDDYLDIPQYERRNSLMIGGNGAYFKWALPQEARAFYALGDLAVETVMGRNPHQNVLGEALKIGTEILPVNPSEGWKAFMPSVAIPFIELALNEDYKGAPIYNDQKWLSKEEKERTAKWSNAYQGTGWTYVKIAQGLNFITGGDKHDAGWINLQPEKLEHLVQSAFGGTIRTADKFINTISAALDPEEPNTVRQAPFLNRFLTINDERFKNVHVNDVFDYYKADAEHALTLEKQYTKDRDKESLTELRRSDEYRWAKIYGKYKKPLKAIQDKIKVADGTAEKKELMKQQDELKKRMIKEVSEL